MIAGSNTLLTAKELREPHIKAAVIDELFASGRVDDDTVIVSEMPVAALPRRADLVVANGSLLGFEIKSDADRTSRLKGQIEAYRSTFEGMVIVTGSKHVSQVLEFAPEPVGVFVIDEIDNDNPKARMLRKPHIRKLDIEASIRQMRVLDLYRLARAHDAVKSGENDRFTLEQRVRLLRPVDVRRAALQAIKARYRLQFEDFKNAKANDVPTLEALRLLRRPAWASRDQVKAHKPDLSSAFTNEGVGQLIPSVTKRRVD